jgi:PAT family beta-lactamase induction signal transducer AmpG
MRAWPSIAIYLERRMLAVLVLGMVSGLPLALTFSTLSVWLVESGVSREAIGLFSAVGTPYALKFLWSPLVDSLPIPWFCRRFGRRIGWMIFTQLWLIISLVMLGFSSPADAAWMTALLALGVAIASATQDIVIDAYRTELLDPEQYAAGGAAAVFGYRIGMLISGGGALFLASYTSWLMTYSIMAALVIPGTLVALWMGEPQRTAPFPARDTSASRSTRLSHWWQRAVIEPFADFLTRQGAWWLLAFVLLFKFGDAFVGVMTNPFLLDIGFSKIEIAQVVKVGGLFATLAGAYIGGVMVARLGLVRSLWIGGIIQLLANGVFILQAAHGHHLGLLWFTIGIDNLSGGLGTAVFVALISGLCNVHFTATQYALLSSLASVGRTFLTTSTGFVAGAVGWSWFFGLSILVALPGVLLIAKVSRYLVAPTTKID